MYLPLFFYVTNKKPFAVIIRDNDNVDTENVGKKIKKAGGRRSTNRVELSSPMQGMLAHLIY